jgi:hypothetical protein
MATSLFEPEELLDVGQFFQAKFGTDACPKGHEDLWRVELTRMMHLSPLFFKRNFAYVVNKQKNLVLLRPWVGQAILNVAKQSQYRNELPVRIVEIKARQLGWTTDNIADAMWYVLDENHRALILVDDEDVAADQATNVGTMLNNLPAWMQPMRRIQNIKHYIFDNPNPKDRLDNPGLNSAIQITVPSSFRGEAPGLVIASEYAHMTTERQIAIQTGIVSAMPMRPESWFIVDTTPNGFDDSYEPMVREAVADNPKWTKRLEQHKGELRASDVLNGALGLPDAVAKGYPGVFIPAVCPWRYHEEYDCRSRENPHAELRPITKAQLEEMKQTLGTLARYGDEEEKELHEKYGVSLSRLFWRRRKIDGYKLPTQDMKLLAFRQEFLHTIDSAFIDSGTVPFDRMAMDALRAMEKPPLVTGLFEGEDQFHQGADNEWQQVRIYAPPQSGEKYTMGVDTDIAYESMNSDATVAQVVRWRDNKVVCTFECRAPDYIVRKQLYYMYRWYFNCYYAIELKGMGYQMIRSCMDMGMRNVYYWKRLDREPGTALPSDYPGWETNEKTRPLMDQTFTELLCRKHPETGRADPDIIIPDEKTIDEVTKLMRQPSGAFKAKSGSHDDHYDALCIALCIARDGYSGMHRRTREQEAEERRPEFEQAFRWVTEVKQTNRPDLSNI